MRKFFLPIILVSCLNIVACGSAMTDYRSGDLMVYESELASLNKLSNEENAVENSNKIVKETDKTPKLDEVTKNISRENKKKGTKIIIDDEDILVDPANVNGAPIVAI